MSKHKVEIWNQGGSGEFKTLSNIADLEHGTILHTTDHAEELAKALEEIRRFGYNNTRCGYTCAEMASKALTNYREAMK